MNDILQRRRFIVFFALIIIKYGYFSFKYYPVLDDWIQYGGYPLYDNIFSDVILRIGTYTTRPLASLSDPYIWGQFWPNMGIVFLIITIVHFISFIFIYKILKQFNIKLGIVFFAIYCLMPIGTEATYWISASSRIIVGLFFMTLSIYMLCIYIEAQRKSYLVLFSVFNLISMFYYEQVSALSFFATILVLIIKRREVKKITYVIPIINLFLLAFYYKFFSNAGNLTNRVELVKDDYMSHIIKSLDIITNVWGRFHIPLIKNGLIRGTSFLLDNSVIYIVLIFAVAFVGGICYKKFNEADFNKKIYLIITGLILFWIPYLPNIVVENVWICNRNLFVSLIGLGLLAEGIIMLIPNNRLISILNKTIIGVIIASFLIINVSEINDYKNASLIDKTVCENIINTIEDEDFYKGAKKAVIFNAKDYYIDQNSFYNDHILNVTSSDWALTGCLRAVDKNINIKYVTPVENKDYINPDQIKSYIILGLDDNIKLYKLHIEKGNDGNYLLYKDNNEKYGIINNNRFIFKGDI